MRGDDEGKGLLAEVRHDFINAVDATQHVIRRELLINILFSRLLFHTMPMMILLCARMYTRKKRWEGGEKKGKEKGAWER